MKRKTKTHEEQKFYGLDGQERLKTDLDDVVSQVVDDARETIGESFDVITSRISWPIRVLVYRKATMGEPEMFADCVIEDLLDRMDEEYGNPDGDLAVATPTMREAATTFVKTVMAEYTPWECEPTGEVIEVTQNEAREMLGE